MRDELLKRHVFCFNPKDNGGEAVMLITDYFDNGDDTPDGIFTNQKLTLQSYCNGASLELVGAAITPDKLRELANELDRAFMEAQRKKESGDE